MISPRHRHLPDNTQHSQEPDIQALPAGFEPTIPASERPQSQVLDRMATGIGIITNYLVSYNSDKVRSRWTFNTIINHKTLIRFWQNCFKQRAENHALRSTNFEFLVFLITALFLGHPEDGGIKVSRISGTCIAIFTASYLRILAYPSKPLLQPQILVTTLISGFRRDVGTLRGVVW